MTRLLPSLYTKENGAGKEKCSLSSNPSQPRDSPPKNNWKHSAP
jgi:hypothetical protein